MCTDGEKSPFLLRVFEKSPSLSLSVLDEAAVVGHFHSIMPLAESLLVCLLRRGSGTHRLPWQDEGGLRPLVAHNTRERSGTDWTGTTAGSVCIVNFGLCEGGGNVRTD